MKLTTDILPRRDGTVQAGKYTFVADESGALSAEVDDEDVGFLLDTGNFYPSDEADFDAGIDAVKPKRGRRKKSEQAE